MCQYIIILWNGDGYDSITSVDLLLVGCFFFGGLLGIGMSTTLLVLCWQDGGADAAAAASGSDGDQAASAAELWIKFEA
jgi:hypothetical protein